MHYSTDNVYSTGMPAIVARGEYDTPVTLSAMRHYGGGGFVAIDITPNFGATLHTVINFDALAEFVDGVRAEKKRAEERELEQAVDIAKDAVDRANDALYAANDAIERAEHQLDYAREDRFDAEATRRDANDEYDRAYTALANWRGENDAW